MCFLKYRCLVDVDYLICDCGIMVGQASEIGAAAVATAIAAQAKTTGLLLVLLTFWGFDGRACWQNLGLQGSPEGNQAGSQGSAQELFSHLPGRISSLT